MKIRVVLEPSEEGGYTVSVPALPGCITEGDSREEALANVKEAIRLYLEPVDDDQRFVQDVVRALRRAGWVVVRQRGSQALRDDRPTAFLWNDRVE